MLEKWRKARADRLINALVDRETGKVTSFSTRGEKIAGEVLPGLGWHAIQAFKMFALWVQGGVWGLAAGAATGALTLYRHRKTVAKFGVIRDEAPRAEVFDLARPEVLHRLQARVGGRHPHFAEDCAFMAERAGIRPAPRILLYPHSGDIRASALSVALGGLEGKGQSAPVIMLGEMMVDRLSTDELRGRVAEQMARIQVKQAASAAKGAARRSFNTVSGIGLAVVSLVADKGPSPELLGLDSGSVAVLSVFASIAARAMTGLRQQADDRRTDRGAILLTGDPEGVKTGLARARALRGEQVADVSKFWIGRLSTRAGLLRQTLAHRVKLIDAFARAQAGFCASRRHEFAPEPAPANQNVPAKPESYGGPKAG